MQMGADLHVSSQNKTGRAWRWLPAVGVALLTLFAATTQLAAAAQSGDGEPAGAVQPADLVLVNRHIVTFRAEVLRAPPAVRVEVVQQRAMELALRGGPLEVTTQPVPEGMAVLLDGEVLFRVLNEDVSPLLGETLQGKTEQAVTNLRLAAAEYREIRDARSLLPAIAYSLLATTLLSLVLWLLRIGYARLAGWIQGLFVGKTREVAPAWSGRIVGSQELAGLAKLPIRLLALAVALLLVYQWAAFVLRQFPYTRPWGETLLRNLLEALGQLGAGLLGAIPGLLFAAAIFVIARLATRITRRFFEGVSAGQINVGWLDETTARPTGKLINAVIWLFAIVAAYPYIPGSGSEAFKGIGVFVGLMLSIGASGIVNQAVSGLMLMYTRALRPGEFVKVGETEGTVKSVGFVTTRIETLRREEVSIPNSVVVGNVTRNFSRLASEGGVFISTKVTIGYDTPWRQVQAMLMLAAERTAGIESEPSPRVRQTALQDFYVEYTLLVNLRDPAKYVTVLDQLHANIQDVFNEFGVQIMSPNYEADPETPKVVPPQRWHEPPARPEEAGKSDRPPAGPGTA
jgi:small-conductance mechanosensitive channel